MNKKNVSMIGCGVLLIVGFISFVALRPFKIISSGNVGVVSTFGSIHDSVLHEGFNLVAPWNSVTEISVRTQEDKEVAFVPTQEGLDVTLEVSVLYSLDPTHAPDILRTVGENYKDVIVIPQFRSAMRGATVKYNAKDLYTAHRSEIEDDLFKVVSKMFAERGIKCERVLLRDVKLPDTVRNAIQKKLATEQESQQMEFINLKETKEAERKRIEAKGIADSQAIIKQTLTHEYLLYLWIKALENAGNHNATIIYVPTGTDGMPMMKTVEPAAKK